MFSSDSVTLKVAGMTCGHCETRVVKAVTSIDGVKSCKASSSKGTVIVKGKLTSDAVEKIKAAITGAGYSVTE